MWELVSISVIGAISYYFFSRIKLEEDQKPIKVETPEIEEIEEEPEDPAEKGAEILLEEGLQAFESGDYSLSEKLIIDSIKKDHKNPKAYVSLGNVFYKEELFEDAISAFKKSSELDPEDDIAINNLGLAYFKVNDYETAMEYFEKSTNLNPNVPSRFINLALASKKCKKLKEAIKALERLTSLEEPANIAHLKMLAELYEDIGQVDKAVKIFTQVLELDPDDTFVKRKLARY